MKKLENSHTFSLGVFPNTTGVDETSPGAKDGSEYVKAGYGEWWGFFQALLDETGVTPSGTIESAGAGLSDMVIGLKRLIGGEKIQPIDASVGANALTITLAPTYLDFRDSTLGSGAVNNRITTSTLTLVISSGSTLGTVDTIQSRIAVIAIDNAGTVELAAVNLAGGNNLDETTLISTVAEGGAGAADSDNVVYSNTLRSNVSYKVVGYIESTQATAGAWATSPSTIQGKGGNVDVGPKNAINTAKAWVNFNGTGAVAIRDSYNVSSITDNGVGDYTVNFTVAMPDVNYAAVAQIGSFNATGGTQVNTFSTTSVRVATISNTSNTDTAIVSLSVFSN